MRRFAPSPALPLSSHGGGRSAAVASAGGGFVRGAGSANHMRRRVGATTDRSQLLGRPFIIASSLCLSIGVMAYATMTLHLLFHSLSSVGGGGAAWGVEGWIRRTGGARILHQPLLVDTRGGAMKQRVRHALDLCPYCLPEKPRCVGYYFSDPDSLSLLGLERLDPNLLRSYHSANAHVQPIVMTEEQRKRQEALEDSKDYRDGAADTFQDQGEDCVAQHDWQETSFPTCNHLMELDLTHLLPPSELFDQDEAGEVSALSFPSTAFRLISSGFYRDVWSVETYVDGPEDFGELFVMKTMCYMHDFEANNYDRHRRDAVAMERLTSSPFIMDIYAACGNSGLYEYAGGGTMEDSVWPDQEATPPWTSEERLIVAYQAAAGVAALHNVGKEGVPSIAHTDIDIDQFVYVDSAEMYKLNDFNRARFIGWNKDKNVLCSFHFGLNGGKVR